MPEPASITIGSIGLFLTFFTAGKALYDDWDSARKFPRELKRERAKLDVQWNIFSFKADLRICDLRTRIDPGNKNDSNTKVLLEYLKSMVELFAECDKIIKNYSPRSLISQHSQESTSEHTAGPSTQNQNSVSKNHKTSTDSKKLKPALMKRLLPGKFKSNKESSVEVPNYVLPRSQEFTLLELDNLERHENRELERLNLSKRATWILGGKRALKSKIEELNSMNQLLTDFLELKSSRDVESLCPDVVNSRDHDIISYTWEMKQLHDAIQAINHNSKPPPGPFLLSVKIQTMEDEASTRRELGTLVGGTYGEIQRIYMLQRHNTSSPIDIPKALIVESSNKYARANPQAEPLQCLDGKFEDIPEHGLAHWGSIDGTAGAPMDYQLYHDTHSPSSFTTLAAIIESQDYHDHITSPQLLKTATLLTTAYLTLSDVRAVCRDPQLRDFRFYRPPDPLDKSETSFDDWAIGEPLILDPWVFFGFGSSKIRQGPLGRTGLQQTSSMSMMRLGLLLYQLASGSVLIYKDNAEGLRQACRQVFKGGLRKIDKVVGSAYTNLVSSCLDFTELDTHLSPAARQELISARLRWIIAQLEACEIHATGDYHPVFAATSETNIKDMHNVLLHSDEIPSDQATTTVESQRRLAESATDVSSPQSSLLVSMMTDKSRSTATELSETISEHKKEYI